MTRKHFQDIAEQLSWVKPKIAGDGKMQLWEVTCFVMADVCEKHSPNFNRSKFYEACGLDN